MPTVLEEIYTTGWVKQLPEAQGNDVKKNALFTYPGLEKGFRALVGDLPVHSTRSSEYWNNPKLQGHGAVIRELEGYLAKLESEICENSGKVR